MQLKQINLTLPYEKEIPEIIQGFSPEENFLMLKIGSECLREGRKVVANLTSEEIFKKIENEFNSEIKNLNNNIEIEKNTSHMMQEKITKIYESQIEQLNKKLENAIKQIENYKQGNALSINEEINKVKEKYDLLLEEKDKQNELNREIFFKAEKLISKNINKSSISIGDDGEQILEYLSETFKDFAGYKLENKAKQGHKGDFHMFFKDFNILIDSKNYSGSVQKKEITKIESDLMVNDNMHFAWLVSLNSNICEYNRFPIMVKWITTEVGVKCIIFINNLLDNKEPRNILRQAWLMCEEFNKLTKKIYKEDGELSRYREKGLIYKKQIEVLQERTSELRRSVNVSLNVLKQMDNDLVDMLTVISDDIVNDKIGYNIKINEWWNGNIEYVKDGSILTSTEIWNKFKKENKEYVLENKLTIENFKSIVTDIVDSSTYVEKNKKSAIEFIGFKWRENETNITENKSENNILDNIVIVPKEKVKKVIKKDKKEN
jgi:hypothetical protein